VKRRVLPVLPLLCFVALVDRVAAQTGNPVNTFAAGRESFAAGNMKAAVASLELAVSQDPKNSQYVLWLGRAYGRRAESANLFLAPRFAIKAREAFERAVQLDPANIDGLNDLFQYHLDAPGFLGGGLDRAAATAELIRRLDPVEYEFDLAKIAEKRREWQNAEGHFRRAVELSPDDPGRLVDLAKFLESRRRHSECDVLFERARRFATKAPFVLIEQARTYVHSHRNLELARSLLNQYLSARISVEDPPHAEAARLLRELSAAPQ
jgi:tetratricopeptide (TPR) repeat protein